jgi:hypothetical protein
MDVQHMGLSNAAVDELRREGERLRAEFAAADREVALSVEKRDRLAAKLKALDFVIKLYDDVEGAGSEANGHDKAAAPMGFREAIRNVLGEAGVRMKPAEVTKRLQKSGFQTASGKTDLTVRVANELWRMAQQGHLQRSSTGYVLKKATPPGAQTPEGS